MTELCIFTILMLIAGGALCFLGYYYGYNKGNLEGYKEGMEDAYKTTSNFLEEELKNYLKEKESTEGEP